MSASSLSQPSSSDPQPASHVQSVLGMVAFACTIACTRYAKDADKAPSMEPRVELLRMSADRVAAFDTVSAPGADAGDDARVGAERFIGSLGDLDERLRPSDWAERLIKTYLAFGLLLDFSKALVGGLDEPLRTAVLDVLEADRFDAVTAAELLDDIAADPQLAARLGLWGRRVVGGDRHSSAGAVGVSRAPGRRSRCGRAARSPVAGCHRAHARPGPARLRRLRVAYCALSPLTVRP